MAYYPWVRQVCVEITGRDNRSAHERFKNATLYKRTKLQQFRGWAFDNFDSLGEAWDALMAMYNSGDYKSLSMILAIEYLVGESW